MILEILFIPIKCSRWNGFNRWPLLIKNLQVMHKISEICIFLLIGNFDFLSMDFEFNEFQLSWSSTNTNTRKASQKS